MSAQVSKEAFSLEIPRIPNNVFHYFKDEPEYMVVPEAHSAGVFGKLIAGVRWLLEVPRRRAVLDELGSLTDHELADVGLTRTDLGRVFDPSFAAERHAERSAIASQMPSTI